MVTRSRVSPPSQGAREERQKKHSRANKVDILLAAHEITGSVSETKLPFARPHSPKVVYISCLSGTGARATQSRHCREVAATTDEESGFALRNGRSRFLSRMRDRDDRRKKAKKHFVRKQSYRCIDKRGHSGFGFRNKATVFQLSCHVTGLTQCSAEARCNCGDRRSKPESH